MSQKLPIQRQRLLPAIMLLLLCVIVPHVTAVYCTGGHTGYANICSKVNENLYYKKAPDHNGCGKRGDTSSHGQNTQKCCRAHDICYSLAGTTMGLCDSEFYACLDQYAPADRPLADLVISQCPDAYAKAQNDYVGCRPWSGLEVQGYVGCFVDSTTRVFPYQHLVPAWGMVEPNKNQYRFTVESCRTECASRKYAYSGVEDGGECFCGNTAPTSEKRPESECSSPCSNDMQQLCGGVWRISVYKTGYLGCFVDTATRDLPIVATDTPRDNMGETGYTPVMCMAECQAKGKRYAGVQYGGYCFCGDTYGSYGVADEIACNVTCSAILETTNSRTPMSCGGTWKNQVYDTNALTGHKMHSFSIKSNMNGYCAQWDTASGNLVSQPCSSSLLQQFVWGVYTIKPLTDNNKCLDMENGVLSGKRVLVYPCNGADNQKWVRDGDRFKPLINRDLCLAIFESNPNAGAQIGIWTCGYSSTDQMWKSLGDTINFNMIISNNNQQLTGVPDYVWLDVPPSTNYAVGRGNGGWDCTVKTSYSKIYIDRKTMMIDTSKRDYATTVVLNGDATTCASRSVPYGTAALCSGSEITSMIDLSNTPYQVTSQFSAAGYLAHGSVVASNNGKTLTINGGGLCGWMATNTANAAGENGAIVFGGQHIKVEMVRQAVTDTGYGSLYPRGWFDLQQQGKYNDYCRYVGNPGDLRLSCALGGSSNEYTLDYVTLTTLSNHVITQSDCMVVYKDCDYNGAAMTITGSVSYFGNDFNDAVSSFRIAPGCTATLYTDANLSGNSVQYSTSIGCLFNNNDSFSSGVCTCP